MESIGVFEAKNRLSALLTRVEVGEELVIMRNGRPVARLVPPLSVGSENARAALAWILGRRWSLEGESIRELIDEGRKF